MRKLLIILSFVVSLSGVLPQTAFAQKKQKRKKEKTETTIEADNKAQFLFIKGEGHFLLKEFAKAIALFSEALSLSPDNEAIYYKISESYYHSGLLNKAIENAQKAVALNKTKKEYYLLLGDVYLSNMQFEESAKTYEEMLANIKGAEEYYYELGELYNEIVKSEKTKKAIYQDNNPNSSSREKEIEKAIELNTSKSINAYTKAEKHYGAHEEITLKKQRLYLGVNKIDDAIEEGNKLIKAFPDELRYKLNQGELIYSNNREQEAIAFMKKVAQELPNDPSPLLMLSDFYNGIGDTKSADEYLEKAFDNPKMDVDSKVKMISTYLQYIDDENKKQTALKLAKRITESHPDKSQAHSIYGDVLYLSDQKSLARNAYYKAAKIDPKKFLIWQQLVSLDAELNQNDSLVAHSNEAITYFPESPILWLYNGLGYQMTKKKQEAVTSLETGLKLSAGDAQLQSQFNSQLGDAYNDVKEYAKSDTAYEKALEFDPNNVYVLNNYSYFLSLRNEKLEQAKAMSERVVRMFPEEATYLDTYAWVLYKMKDYHGAKKYLERALESSNDGTVIEHYGDVLFQLGKEKDALEYWVKAKQQGGATEFIDKKINDKKLYE